MNFSLENMAGKDADKAYLQGVLDENARTATYLANKTLRKVQKKVGFPERIR